MTHFVGAGTGSADAAGELEVLFPDVPVVVRDPDTGEAVPLTVREFRFREGLEAQARARPVVEALAALVPAAGAPDDALPSPAAVDAALAAHADAWLALVARACGRSAGWLARLGDADARALSDAMWSANGGFFVRRVVAGLAARRATARLFRSLASSTPSSAPDTGAATLTSRSV